MIRKTSLGLLSADGDLTAFEERRVAASFSLDLVHGLNDVDEAKAEEDGAATDEAGATEIIAEACEAIESQLTAAKVQQEKPHSAELSRAVELKN